MKIVHIGRKYIINFIIISSRKKSIIHLEKSQRSVEITA